MDHQGLPKLSGHCRQNRCLKCNCLTLVQPRHRAKVRYTAGLWRDVRAGALMVLHVVQGKVCFLTANPSERQPVKKLRVLQLKSIHLAVSGGRKRCLHQTKTDRQRPRRQRVCLATPKAVRYHRQREPAKLSTRHQSQAVVTSGVRPP